MAADISYEISCTEEQSLILNRGVGWPEFSFHRRLALGPLEPCGDFCGVLRLLMSKTLECCFSCGKL